MITCIPAVCRGHESHQVTVGTHCFYLMLFGLFNLRQGLTTLTILASKLMSLLPLVPSTVIISVHHYVWQETKDLVSCRV